MRGEHACSVACRNWPAAQVAATGGLQKRHQSPTDTDQWACVPRVSKFVQLPADSPYAKHAQTPIRFVRAPITCGVDSTQAAVGAALLDRTKRQ